MPPTSPSALLFLKRAIFAAAFALAALLASNANADHFCDNNNCALDGTEFARMCEAVGGQRQNCLTTDNSNVTAACITEREGSTVTTFINGKKYKGCRASYTTGEYLGLTDDIGCFAGGDFAGIDTPSPVPECHDAFPKCPDGSTYNSQFTFLGETKDNLLSGCTCPEGKTRNAAGVCVCAPGQIESVDGLSCLSACPAGRVSNGAAENPRCVVDCRTHLDGGGENPNAVLIPGQPPVPGLISTRTENDDYACRCPNSGFVTRDGDGAFSCAAECDTDFISPLYDTRDPRDVSLQFCHAPEVGGCTKQLGYTPVVSGTVADNAVADGTAASLCDVRHLDLVNGRRSGFCILSHVNPTVSLITHEGQTAPRCRELYSGNVRFSDGIPRWHGARSNPRRVASYRTCADGKEYRAPESGTSQNPACDACAAGLVSSGGAACRACSAQYERANAAQSACDDIDECAEGTHTCLPSGSHGICANRLGDGFSCSCAAGYWGDGTVGGSGCVAANTVSYSSAVGGTLRASRAGAGEGAARVSVASGDLVPRGETVAIFASADSGYYLSSWTGDCAGIGRPQFPRESGAEADCRFQVSVDVEAGAVFRRAWQVTISPAAQNGEVRTADENPQLVGGGWAADGATVTFQASPENGFYVLEWRGACAGAEAGAPSDRAPASADAANKYCARTANANLEAGAIFALARALNYQADPSFGRVSARLRDGTALPAAGDVRDGTTVIFTAHPDAGYYVESWESGRLGDCGADFSNPNLDSSAQECETTVTLDVLNHNTDAPLPVMRPLPRSTVHFGADAEGVLTAHSGGKDLTDGADVFHGASVTFRAEANSGYAAAWFGACAGESGGTGPQECAAAARFGAEISVSVSFSDVDECAADICGTNSMCVNSPGSFSCTCDGGFYSETDDGRNCVELNQAVCDLRDAFFDGTECVARAVCAGAEELNLSANVCECNSPNVRAARPGESEECMTPSADACGLLTPERFYDSDKKECADFLDCDGASTYKVLRRSDNTCHCPSARPFEYEGVCETPSADFCGGLTPPQFYDSSARECVALAACSFEEERNNAQNICECPPPKMRVNGECRGLHMSARSGFYLTALTLISNSADVDLKNADGDAPLHLALRAERREMITLLVRRGANVNLPDAAGDAALHYAARFSDSAENVLLAQFLLERNADANLRNVAGWRPLDLAYHGGDADDASWSARREMMSALIAGGGLWGASGAEWECGGGMIPNGDYDASGNDARCVCPAAESEVDGEGMCGCPAETHARVNELCLPRGNSEEVAAEVERMRMEFEDLLAELVSLNARISMAAESPDAELEEVEVFASRAEAARRGVERRWSNFRALAAAGLADEDVFGDLSEPPPVALSDTAATCRALGGEVRTHSATGIRICLGVDANNTFCLVDSGGAFPCHGLFHHIRICNDKYNRLALNPFFCGEHCEGETPRARGRDCVAEN